MVNSCLIRPAISWGGGWHWGGPLGSHDSWWLNQPLWKICSSKWVHLSQFLGWKFQKYLSCHHPGIVHSNLETNMFFYARYLLRTRKNKKGLEWMSLYSALTLVSEQKFMRIFSMVTQPRMVGWNVMMLLLLTVPSMEFRFIPTWEQHTYLGAIIHGCYIPGQNSDQKWSSWPLLSLLLGEGRSQVSLQCVKSSCSARMFGESVKHDIVTCLVSSIFPFQTM